jgi:hypothetical protein
MTVPGSAGIGSADGGGFDIVAGAGDSDAKLAVASDRGVTVGAVAHDGGAGLRARSLELVDVGGRSHQAPDSGGARSCLHNSHSRSGNAELSVAFGALL